MKKLLIGVACALAVVAVVGSRTTAKSAAPAVHINDFGCGLLDGDGNFVIADSSRAVITSSGNANLNCKVSDVANSTGRAVHYDFESTGSLCNVLSAGTTASWHETVSASGNATLSCRVK